MSLIAVGSLSACGAASTNYLSVCKGAEAFWQVHNSESSTPLDQAAALQELGKSLTATSDPTFQAEGKGMLASAHNGDGGDTTDALHMASYCGMKGFTVVTSVGEN